MRDTQLTTAYIPAYIMSIDIWLSHHCTGPAKTKEIEARIEIR